eukprot:246752-Amphidinium_carterae.1
MLAAHRARGTHAMCVQMNFYGSGLRLRPPCVLSTRVQPANVSAPSPRTTGVRVSAADIESACLHPGQDFVF